MARISRSMCTLKSRPDSTSMALRIGEVPDALGQVGGIRHRRAVEQHRQHGNVALECGLELDPDRIGLVHDAELAARLRAEPFLADHGDQHVARLQRVVDLLAEIDPERDVVDIDEQVGLAEMLRQPVEDAPGHGGIGPAIGEDDLWSSGPQPP